MVKQLFSLFIFCCAISTSFAQNLVPNPSFEDYGSDCPVNLNDLPLYWEAWRSSPDCFNTCVTPQNLGDSLGWAPWNGFGYQEPFSGASYCGFSAFSPSPSEVTDNDYREFLGCELITPLEIGETYQFSCVISLGFAGSYANLTYASNRIGTHLGFEAYEWLDNPMPIPNYAQVYTNEVITDTIGWTEISGEFIADQAYTHLALGVFYDFDSLEILQMSPGPSLGSYYFVDEVCLNKAGEGCGVAQSIQNTEDDFQYYPNPVNSEFKLKSSQSVEFRLFNSKGKECLSGLVSNNELLQVDVNHLAPGIYYLIIQAESKIRREKLVIARE